MKLPAAKIIFGVALALTCGVPSFFAWQGHSHSKHAPGATQKVPAYYKSEAEAKPFPKTLPPEKFGHPVIQRAYRIAREIPGVLAQQPCYCYCDRQGHKGLLDCHRDNHSAG